MSTQSGPAGAARDVVEGLGRCRQGHHLDNQGADRPGRPGTSDPVRSARIQAESALCLAQAREADAGPREKQRRAKHSPCPCCFKDGDGGPGPGKRGWPLDAQNSHSSQPEANEASNKEVSSARTPKEHGGPTHLHTPPQRLQPGAWSANSSMSPQDLEQRRPPSPPGFLASAGR